MGWWEAGGGFGRSGAFGGGFLCGHSVPLACVACVGHVTLAYTLAREREGESERVCARERERTRGLGKVAVQVTIQMLEHGGGGMLGTCS